MTMRCTLIALCSVIALSLPAAAQDEKPKVVASFSIIGNFAANVGRDLIDLKVLVGPDGDAHAYEPRPADAVAVSKADVVLVNGLGFEGFLARLVKASATKAAIVEVSKGAETIRPGEGDHDAHDEQAHDQQGQDARKMAETHQDGEDRRDHPEHGDIDPHAWHSVANAKTYVKNIARALCAAETSRCDAYKDNARAYLAKLEDLDREIRDSIARIPQAKRVVITPHNAFGYLAHEYGIRFLAPEGISTDSEASAADVAKLIRQIREHKASAVFMENVSDPRLVEQIARETGAAVGGVLYSDALSGPDGPAPTYIGMMRHNVRTIVSAILGS